MNSAESRLRRGALLDLVTTDFRKDRLRELRTILSIEGKLVPLETVELLPDVTGQRPGLVVVQQARELRVTTSIELSPEQPQLRLDSTVENVGRYPKDEIRLGDRIEWPGTPTFAPRLGFVAEPGHIQAPWIAKESAMLSYALVFDEGPQLVEFVFDRVGSSENLTFGKSHRLEPGAKARYRRTVVVSERGLGAVSEAAFRLLRRQLGEVRGIATPPPKRAFVQALLPDGKPLTQVEVSARGEFAMVLPAGEYTISLRTPGGVDEERIRLGAKEVERVELLAPVAGSLRYTIDDESGTPMPGRLAIRGVHPTKNPDLGAKQSADGIRNVVYSARGEGVVELPPGEYRVFVTRGFEYGIFEQRIAVDTNVGASVRARLSRKVDTPGWVSGDFHLHAAPSFDSSVPLLDRVISLAAEGVEFAVATDHNHVTDYGPAVRDARLESELAVSPGVEITTQKWGHFIAFPYSVDRPPPPYEGVEPGAIFEAIRMNAPRSVIQVNHPRLADIAYFAGLNVHESLVAVGDQPPAESDASSDQTPSGPRLGGSLLDPPLGFSFDFDTVEVVNGFDLGKPEVMTQNLRDWFALLNLGYRYTAVGNSDSHSLVYQWAGYPRTYVKLGTEDLAMIRPDEVASALLYGRAQISGGIFLDVTVNGTAGPGDELTAKAGRVTLRVLPKAASWVSVSSAEVWVNGVVRAQTTKVAPPSAKNRIQWTTQLKLASDAWLVVIARGDEDLGEQFPGGRGTPFAISNPVYVDVDADGVFRAPLAPESLESTPGVAVGAHQH